MSFSADILPIISDVMEILQTELRKNAEAQGHSLTGKLAESIEFEIEDNGDEVIGKMFAEDYGLILEFGTRADRVPFSGKTGAGGTSLYIQGLIDFWENRGLSGRDAIGAAFATAHVQAREGMPTKASGRFSSTGERTGFIRTTIEQNLSTIGSIIQDRYGAFLEIDFAKNLGQYDNIKFVG